MDVKYKFNPEMYKTVGKNVKKYREEKGMSLEELSECAEIKRDFLEKFENPEENSIISIYDLYKISVILEETIDKFFID